MTSLLSRLRYALRQLRQSPGFAFTVILTLALGIGASTAIFAVLDAVLLDPLPFAEPGRLVAVVGQPDKVMSIPTMEDYQSRSSSFAGVAAYRYWNPKQEAVGAAAAHRFLIVTQGFFSTLGTRFALGSAWPSTGNEQDCSSQAVVSGAFWKRLGGGKTLGSRVLRIDGRDFHIAGVLPVEQAIEGTGALRQPEVFVPIGCDASERPNNRGSASFQVLGRLRPGVTLGAARADLARVDRTLRRDYPSDYPAAQNRFFQPPQVIPYVDMLVGAESRPALLLTFAACGLLLVIACANLANLLLARNTRRRAEFAVRAALGATIGQLLRQLLLEAAVLVALGGAAGIALAAVVLQLLKSNRALDLPRLAHTSLSLPVLTFVLATCAALTFVLTLLPAQRTLRHSLLRELAGFGRSSAGRSLRLAGRLLVVAQLTTTCVLLAAAGWTVGSVYLLLHQPLGFAPDHLLMVQANYPVVPTAADPAAGAEQKLGQMAESLSQLSGVVSVALAQDPPLGHHVNRYDFCSDLHPGQCRQQVNLNPNSADISPGYFRTVGQPLLAGRDFNAADNGRNPVAIVNHALAEREWPGQSAVGHRIRTGELQRTDTPPVWATVVGVAGNVHDYDLVAPPGPELYIPRLQRPSSFGRFIIRTSGDPVALEYALKARLKTLFPEAEVWSFETISQEMAGEVSERVFLMQVAVAFGAVALFLSVLGTYGLLSYEVSLREKEIGIRLALGSTREKIVALLLRQEGRWLALGALLGLAAAAATGRLLQSRIYGAHAMRLPVLAGSALLLLIPAILAAALPARRAALTDPAQILRRE